MNARQPPSGFTLFEVLLVLTIAGLIFATSAGSLSAMLDTMQYREAVRTLESAAKNARRKSIRMGIPVDLLIDARKSSYLVVAASSQIKGSDMATLPDSLTFGVTSAAEVSRDTQIAAIRFYPSGGSTGGEITIRRESGAGVVLNIDWLLGLTTQQPLG